MVTGKDEGDDLRARRTDANHQTIAGYFERLGCLVHHSIDCWDLTVARMGVCKLIEIKDPDKPPSKKKLTTREQKFIDAGWPIKRVETMDDCLKVVAEMRDEAMRRDL